MALKEIVVNNKDNRLFMSLQYDLIAALGHFMFYDITYKPLNFVIGLLENKISTRNCQPKDLRQKRAPLYSPSHSRMTEPLW